MTSESLEPTHDNVEVQEENGTEVPELSAEPTLNRAERRAQAKGKKAPLGKSSNVGFQSGNAQGAGFRGTGFKDKSRFPRTGHK